MQKDFAELTRKYQEELLRLYEKKRTDTPALTERRTEDFPIPDYPAEPEPLVTEPVTEEPEQTTVPGQSEMPPEDAAPMLPDARAELDDHVSSGDDGDPEVPQYIRPIAMPIPEDWGAQEAYERRNIAEGYLRVVTATAESAYPVPNAKVSVFTNIGNKAHLSYLLVTNESGETPTVALPAPAASLSQESGNIKPYASCEIHVAAKGFFKTKASDVRIFAGVTTRQVFQLVPLPLNSTPAEQEIDPNAIGTEKCPGGEPC